jgi:DNA-binding Xre family transcriptional regulator
VRLLNAEQYISTVLRPQVILLLSVIIYPCYFDAMIKTHVQEIAKKRGITTAYQLQKALDISPSVASKLWSDDFELISRTSLDRLCTILKIQPGRLISFAPKRKINK